MLSSALAISLEVKAKQTGHLLGGVGGLDCINKEKGVITVVMIPITKIYPQFISVS